MYRVKCIFIKTIVLFLFSCNDKQIPSYKLPNNNDIESIIETIILDDSIPVLKYDTLPDTINDRDGISRVIFPIKHPFCIDLEKFHIVFSLPENENNMELTPPLPFGNILFRNIINEEPNLFAISDSSYISYQNDSLNYFVIKGDLTKKIYTTTSDKQTNKDDTYFSCSIPVFSADKTKAYVELTYHCYSLCGSSALYLLSKTNDQWRIVKRRITSIS